MKIYLRKNNNLLKIFTVIALLIFSIGFVFLSINFNEIAEAQPSTDLARFDAVYPSNKQTYVDIKTPSATATYNRPGEGGVEFLSKFATTVRNTIEIRTTSNDTSSIVIIPDIIDLKNYPDAQVVQMTFIGYDFLFVCVKGASFMSNLLYRISTKEKLDFDAAFSGMPDTVTIKNVVTQAVTYNINNTSTKGLFAVIAANKILNFEFSYQDGVTNTPLLFTYKSDIPESLNGTKSNLKASGAQLYFLNTDNYPYNKSIMYHFDGTNLKQLARDLSYNASPTKVTQIASFELGKDFVYFISTDKTVLVYNLTELLTTPLNCTDSYSPSKYIASDKSTHSHRPAEYYHNNAKIEGQTEFQYNDLSSIIVSKTFASSEEIYITDNKSKKIIVFECNNNYSMMLTPRAIISSYGNSIDKLSSPSDIAIAKGEKTAYVADTKNARIMKYSIKDGTGEFTDPVSITDAKIKSPVVIESDTKNGGFYVFDSVTNHLLYFDSNDQLKYSKQYAQGGVVVDLEFTSSGVLLMLERNDASANKLHMIKISEANQLGSQKTILINKGYGTPKYLETGFSSKSAYISFVSESGTNFIDVVAISHLEQIGSEFNDYAATPKIKVDLSKIKNSSAFIVDFNGNIVIIDNSVSQSALYKFSMTSENSYNLGTKFSMSDYNFSSDFINCSGAELTASGAIYLINSGKSIIHKYTANSNANTLGITTPTLDNFKHPTKENYRVNTFAGKIGDDCRILLSPINFSESLLVTANDYFYVLAELEYPKESGNFYYYGVHSSGFGGYIRKTSISDNLAGTSNTDMGTTAIAMHSTVRVYDYPYLTTDTRFNNNLLEDVASDTVFSIIDNVAVDGGKAVWQNDEIKWYKVGYKSLDGTEKFGYVLKSDITPNIAMTPPSTSKSLIVQSSKVGERIAMYALPDIASYILYSVPDGTEVKLVGKFDKNSQFVQVVYQGKTGYILTNNVIEKGLTTVQIIMIVVVSIALVVTSITIALIVYFRKKAKSAA